MNHFKDNKYGKTESKYDLYQKRKNQKTSFNQSQDEQINSQSRIYTLQDDFKFDEGIVVKLKCHSLSYDARGVCKVNGVTKKGLELVNYPIFVEGILPDESANILITSLKKSYGEGKVLELKHLNFKARNEPICPNYKDCGGCDIMHMLYNFQCDFKYQQVIDTLNHIGGFDYHEINSLVKSDKPFNYRNKVQVPFQMYNGKTICGFFKKNTHKVVSMDNCYIQSELSNDIVKFIKNLCNEFKIAGYDETHHEGLIRHVVIRENKDQSEVMVIFVSLKEKINNLDLLLQKLLKRYKMVTSVILNINQQVTNKILGDKNIVLYGKDYIIDELLGTQFKIGPMSFYQVNTLQTEKLYQTVINQAHLTKDDVVIDAYCGIGTIGLCIAPLVKKVYGVEIVSEAIDNANDNKKLNKIDNIEFICGKSEDIINDYAKTIKPDLIVMDPPRKGCEKEFLDTAINMGIPKIIYVSCNPATLARDLRILVDNNYSIQSITPVDMFSQSNHIETVCLLIKKSPK